MSISCISQENPSQNKRQGIFYHLLCPNLLKSSWYIKKSFAQRCVCILHSRWYFTPALTLFIKWLLLVRWKKHLPSDHVDATWPVRHLILSDFYFPCSAQTTCSRLGLFSKQAQNLFNFAILLAKELILGCKRRVTTLLHVTTNHVLPATQINLGTSKTSHAALELFNHPDPVARFPSPSSTLTCRLTVLHLSFLLLPTWGGIKRRTSMKIRSLDLKHFPWKPQALSHRDWILLCLHSLSQTVVSLGQAV